MSRDVLLYLDDMIEACERVQRYTQPFERNAFQANSMAYDAVLRNLEVLGEAAKRVPPDVRQRAPDIRWRDIAGLRDVLAHAYFGIDEDIIWSIVADEIPDLLPRLKVLRALL